MTWTINPSTFGGGIDPRFLRKFWDRVDKNGPYHPVVGQCWFWTGFLMKNGYGKLTGMGLAHRYSWGITNGLIPTGLHVLHKCDNPACVNPDHLFLGTHQENLADMRAKGRQPRGERQGSSKLTADPIRYIRKRYKRYSHKDGTGAIARELGVKHVQVWRIVKLQQWRHIL